MTNILERILVTKKSEIEYARSILPLDLLRERALEVDPPRDFLQAMHHPDGIRLLAEIKKASPSKGLIRAEFEPAWLAKQYELGGANALSVLTDVEYFQGSLEYLSLARNAVTLPVLRKDFIIDEYQVFEARAAGADAILLIAECLDGERLQTLYDLSMSLGMQPLIELYDEENLPMVLDTGCLLVGVNNRDLRTFEVDLDRTLRLRDRIPTDRYLVAESGIETAEDAARLWRGGVSAMLVGESLMRQADVANAVRRLLSGTA